MPRKPQSYRDYDNPRRLEVLLLAGPLRRAETDEETSTGLTELARANSREQYHAAQKIDALFAVVGGDPTAAASFIENKLIAKLGSKARFTAKEKKKAGILMGRFVRGWREHFAAGTPPESGDDSDRDSSSSGISQDDCETTGCGPFFEDDAGESKT